MSGEPTRLDAPNQQVVRADGSGPADEGDGGSIAESFDPGEHNVGDVEAYIAEHPGERDAVLEAERAGKNRTSLVGAPSEDDAEGQ